MTKNQVTPHYRTNYPTVEELLARYHRGEVPILKYFLGLAKALEDNNFPYLWIGSGPVQLLTDPKYRPKVSKSTDIDIVTSENPEKLLPFVGSAETIELVKEHLIDKSYYGSFRGFTVKENEGVVYHFLRKGNEEALPFCVFHNEVNVIPVYESDFEKRGSIQVDGRNLYVPQMGLMLATRLHPQALQKARIYKSMLITQSMRDQAEARSIGVETKERFKDALRSHSNRLSVTDFQTARRRLESMGKRKRFDKFLAYVEEAFSF